MLAMDEVLEVMRRYGDAIILVRALYLAMISGIAVIYLSPRLSERLLSYGPSDHHGEEDATSASSSEGQNGQSTITRLLDSIASIRVPHSWFTHFYVVSVVSSVFWAWQACTRGKAFTSIVSFTPDRYSGQSLPIQTVVVWCCMLAQGVRRLLECSILRKGNVKDNPSSSTMFIGHYVMGCLFYALINVAIWIEAGRKSPIMRSSQYRMTHPTDHWDQYL